MSFIAPAVPYISAVTQVAAARQAKTLGQFNQAKKFEEANFARIQGNVARQQAKAAEIGYYAQAGTSLLKAF